MKRLPTISNLTSANNTIMAYLAPDTVYQHALQGVARAAQHYAIPSQVALARVMVAQAFEESCIDKNTPGRVCFNTKAKAGTTSATGVWQQTKPTQRQIEKMMGWPQRPYADREDPQYSGELAAAYMAYFLNGARKTPKGDLHGALVAYHDGHWSKNGAGNAYARLILNNYYPLFDFAAMERSNSLLDTLAFGARREFN